MSAPQTLFDKIWQNHLVNVQEDGTCLLYIDRHLVHEVTSPQAFEGLRNSGRTVRRTDATLAVPDHNVSTKNRQGPIENEVHDTDGRIERITDQVPKVMVDKPATLVKPNRMEKQKHTELFRPREERLEALMG